MDTRQPSERFMASGETKVNFTDTHTHIYTRQPQRVKYWGER